MDRDIALLLVGALEDIQEAVETIATNTTPPEPPAGLSMSPIGTLDNNEPDSPSVEPEEPLTNDKK